MSSQIKKDLNKGKKDHAAAPAAKVTAKAPFVFGRMNYILSAVSLLVVCLGFVLMSGREGDIYDFRRITLAPIVVILGFCLGFVAIFWKDKTGTEEQA